jgi:hypothetical protein
VIRRGLSGMKRIDLLGQREQVISLARPGP